MDTAITMPRHEAELCEKDLQENLLSVYHSLDAVPRDYKEPRVWVYYGPLEMKQWLREKAVCDYD